MSEFDDYLKVKQLADAFLSRAPAGYKREERLTKFLSLLCRTSSGPSGNWAPELNPETDELIPTLPEFYKNAKAVVSVGDTTLCRLTIIAVAGLSGKTLVGKANKALKKDTEDRLIFAVGTSLLPDLRTQKVTPAEFRVCMNASMRLYAGIVEGFAKYCGGINACRARTFRYWWYDRKAILHDEDYVYKDARGENCPEFLRVVKHVEDTVFAVDGLPDCLGPRDLSRGSRIREWLAEFIRVCEDAGLFPEEDTDRVGSLDLLWRASGMSLSENPFRSPAYNTTRRQLREWLTAYNNDREVPASYVFPAVWLCTVSDIFYNMDQSRFGAAQDILRWLTEHQERKMKS